MTICVEELCDLMTEDCSESRMRSWTLRGVSKWTRRKDRYIGRLYSDIGKVLSDSGIFRSTVELREYGGTDGPYWRERRATKGRPPPFRSPNWTREGGRRPFPTPSPSPSFPLSSFWWTPTRTWSPSRIPHLWARLLGSASSSLPPLYTGE